MIRIELKPVCMDCGHADIEIEVAEHCGFAASLGETVIRCSHAGVCRMIKGKDEE